MTVWRTTQLLFLSVLASFFVACIPSNVGSDFRYGNHHITLASVDELYRFLTYHEKRFPLISAHRGGPSEGFPENALETFDNNFRQQPLIIECDVHPTKDDVLVLMHDETLDRTTTGKGKLRDKELSELKKLQLKDVMGNVTNYRIPTLDEALQWGAGKVIFTIDVKRDVSYAAVIEAIRRNDAEAYCIIITYSADQAAVVHQLAPDVMISASIHSASDLLRLNDNSIPDNRLIAFVGTHEADQALYDLLHEHGIFCILGTMGNLDQQAAKRGDTVYSALVERGADVLSTDRPVEAGEALYRYRNQHQLTSRYIK